MAKRQIGTRARKDGALATLQDIVKIIEREEATRWIEVIAGDRTKGGTGWAAPRANAVQLRLKESAWENGSGGAISTEHQAAWNGRLTQAETRPSL